MLDIIFRFLKRIVVLLPGLAVAYFVTTDVYPFLDRGVPHAIAILAAYILAAYVLIPALMRVIRFFVRPKHIPLYCTTPDGFASDPINIGLMGTKEQVKKAMEVAGWFEADPRNLKTLLRYATAMILRWSYPTAPFSNLYLFGRSQDMGFQLPTNENPHHRHHVRFWASEPRLSDEQEEHLKFWRKYSTNKRPKKNQLWLGAASLDTGLGIIRHSGQITHMIHPDTDSERDLIVNNLELSGKVQSTRDVTVGKPYSLRNRVFKGRLNADGKMTIVTLK